MRKLVCAFAAVAMLTSLGCGGATETLFPVTGKVTLDGKPLEGATVTFNYVGEGVARKPSGITDENGVYELTYATTDGEPGKGAPAGEYWVSIRKSEKGDEEDADTEVNEADMAKQMEAMATETGVSESKSLIPEKYGTKSGSPWQKIVVAESKDGNTIETFELKMGE